METIKEEVKGKTVEYDVDENDKILDIRINGKPVKRGFMRGINKAQETDFWLLFLDEGYGRNPYSGVEVELSPLQMTIYRWCLTWYNIHYGGGLMPTKMLAPIQTYDDMKYLFLELDSNAYFDLLD